MYNENVMKYTGGTLPEVYDEEEDIVVYDDSSEWYNQYNDENDGE